MNGPLINLSLDLEILSFKITFLTTCKVEGEVVIVLISAPWH